MLENKIKSKIVETYAEDMARVIEDDREGLIKKIIHGEEEHEKEKMELSPESKKNRALMLASLVCVITALALFSFLFLNRNKINTVPVAKQFIPIIFNDKSVFLEIKDLKKDEIATTVFKEVMTTEVKNGGVEGIYLSFDKKIVSLREFLTLLKSSFFPTEDNFINDHFLMGVVKGETNDFFILLQIRDFIDVFDSLRIWENKMFFDLHGFFGVNISTETNYLLTKEFQNGVVENKNARILYTQGEDQEKKIVMMYIFADDTSIIITNTENAVREIILRLAASQIKK